MSKTIILIRNTSPDAYGGGETYQLRLAQELKNNGFRPLIISSSRPLVDHAREARIATFSAPYLKWQNWSSWRNLLLPLYAFWQLRLYFWYRSVFKKYRPAATIIESRDDWLAATRASRRFGIKTFWLDHMDFRSWVLQNVNQPFKNLIGKHILHLAPNVNKIIFISDFERNYFEKATKPRQLSNLITIKNGAIDSAADFQDVKAPAQSFAYVGRVVDYKGINELLSAFKKVHTKYPKAALHIYGDGDKKLIRKAEVTPGVAYHGFTDKPLAAIASSQIFVLPSYREGLSLSLLDAAMLGRTIIASNIDGNPEIVKDHETGLLIPARSGRALSAAMLELLENPTLATKLGHAARRHYEQNFNFAHIVKTQLAPLLEAE